MMPNCLVLHTERRLWVPLFLVGAHLRVLQLLRLRMEALPLLLLVVQQPQMQARQQRL